MPNGIATDRYSEMAALYVVGMLEPEELRDFESHLEAGCEDCQAEVAALRECAAAVPLALPQQAAPPRVREELSKRIRSGGGGPRGSGGDLHVVRANEGDWVETGWDGVRLKSLFYDPVKKVRTMLVRMDPGA